MFDILDTGGVPVPTIDVPAPGPASAHAPLEQLLLEPGLLTEEQLQTGLAQQQWSGRPLGEVLIALGFLSESTIAQALATQHGGLLKTEYGLATGFGTSLPGATAPAPPISPPAAQVRQSPTTAPASRPEPELAAATAVPLHQTIDVAPASANPALEAAQAEVAAAPARIVELEGELEAAQARSGGESARIAELEGELQRERQRADEAEPRIAELEQEVAKARNERAAAANAAFEIAQAHVGAADARIAKLEQELTAVQQGETALWAEYERRGAELDAVRNELATRQGELASTVETLRAVYARLQYLESAPEPIAPQPELQVAPQQQPPSRDPGQRHAAFAWQS